MAQKARLQVVATSTIATVTYRHNVVGSPENPVPLTLPSQFTPQPRTTPASAQNIIRVKLPVLEPTQQKIVEHNHLRLFH